MMDAAQHLAYAESVLNAYVPTDPVSPIDPPESVMLAVIAHTLIAVAIESGVPHASQAPASQAPA